MHTESPNKHLAPFAKMHGLGNQIFIADLQAFALDTSIDSSVILQIAQDKTTHFDQMMVIYKQDEYIIKIYNADGSKAGACGNGMRCVSRYIYETSGQRSINARTCNGLLHCEYRQENEISVQMGKPAFSSEAIGLSYDVDSTACVVLHPQLPPAFLLSMGNPHAIFFLDRMLSLPDIKTLGALLENHDIFKNRCNISFAKVIDKHNIQLYSWERGAGLTQACGSAACACLVAAIEKNLCQSYASIMCLGGQLKVLWKQSEQVELIGPADLEFYGNFNINNGKFKL